MTDNENQPLPQTLLALLMEAASTFHKMRALGRKLGAVSDEGGSWGLLRSLLLQGPQTVPQLAKSRPVARQHIQVLVNALLDEGLVELRDNPAHKRSKLVGITADGEDRYRETEARILKLLNTMTEAFDAADVGNAIRTVEQLNAAMNQQLEEIGQ